MANKPKKSRKSEPRRVRGLVAKHRKDRKTRTKGSKKSRRRRQNVRGRASSGSLVTFEQRGLGARSGGQSGDTQGLSTNPAVDSESVEELAEEGQAFEAEVLNGVERAPDPDESEVFTREVAEDDVPEEYLEKD